MIQAQPQAASPVLHDFEMRALRGGNDHRVTSACGHYRPDLATNFMFARKVRHSSAAEQALRPKRATQQFVENARADVRVPIFAARTWRDFAEIETNDALAALREHFE
jgi:hypothetical protein